MTLDFGLHDCGLLNIRKLVQTLQGAGVPVVLARIQTVQNLGEEYTNTFRAIYPAVAEEYNLSLIVVHQQK